MITVNIRKWIYPSKVLHIPIYVFVNRYVSYFNLPFLTQMTVDNAILRVVLIVIHMRHTTVVKHFLFYDHII